MRTALALSLASLVLAACSDGDSESVSSPVESESTTPTDPTPTPSAPPLSGEGSPGPTPEGSDFGPVAQSIKQTFTDFQGYEADVVYKVHETRQTQAATDSDLCSPELAGFTDPNYRFKVTTIQVAVTPRTAGDFSWPEGSVIPTSVNDAEFGAAGNGTFRISCGDGTSTSVESSSIDPPVLDSKSQFTFEVVTGSLASPANPQGAFDEIDPATLTVGAASAGGSDGGVNPQLCANAGGDYNSTAGTCTYSIE